MPGSLLFGGATSDRVDIGSAAGIDDMNPFTILMWVNVNTLTNQRCFWTKATNAGTTFGLFRLTLTAGDVQFSRARATTGTAFTTNNTPLASTGAWKFLAVNFDTTATAGNVCNIYAGGIGTAATECTYSTATDGSGAITSDAAGNFVIGNNEFNRTTALQGNIAMFAIFKATMSLADIQSWQLRPRVTVGSNTAQAFFRLGNEGNTTQQDYSGNANTGTTTGATQGNGPGLDQGDCLWQRDSISGLYQMSA